MRTPRIARAAAALAAAALITTGCSANNPGTTSSSDGAGAGSQESTWNDPTADLTGVTLTYWTATQTATMADGVIAAFEKATGATINKVIIPDVYETNAPTKLATGAKPDLATWQPTGSQLALLQPQTNLQPLDDAPWADKQVSAVQDLGTVDGTHYAAFVNTPSTLGVFYNKKVFADAGITDPPADFDELVADAKKIGATGVAPIFGAAGDQWPTQWWPQVLLAEDSQAGLWEKVNEHQLTFGDEPIIGAIKSYQDMLDQGLFNDDNATSTYTESAPALLDGKAGMVLQNTSFTSLLQASADTETINSTVGWFPISRDGDLATSIPGGDNALVAFKSGDATREAAARQFLTFWLDTYYPTYVEDSNVVSLEPDVPTPGTVPDVAVAASDALDGAAGSMQQDAIANPDFYVNLANMVVGTMTPEEVATATQSQFAQIASALGADGF